MVFLVINEFISSFILQINTNQCAAVVQRTTERATTACSNPSECLQLPSAHIPRSNWTSMLLSDCLNNPSKFSVPTEFIQCRKYKWSILGSSSMKVLLLSLFLYCVGHKKCASKINIKILFCKLTRQPVKINQKNVRSTISMNIL